MAQINLLKQQSESESLIQKAPTILVRILAVLALAVIAYYAWMYIREKRIVKEIQEVETNVSQLYAEAMSIPGRQELFTRQGQLKEYMTISSAHKYFSQIFLPLAQVTLKTAKYSNFQASEDGTINLSTTVPDIKDVDKFIQIFNIPQFYENFSDVRIGSLNRLQDETGVSYRFDLTMKYNPQIISAK